MIALSFYILFLIPSFLIYSYKLFSMQLGPGTIYLACARLIVPFVPFTGVTSSLLSDVVLIICLWSTDESLLGIFN